MIGKIFQFFFRLVIYVLIFIGLAWALLGITPSETYVRSRNSFSLFWAHVSDFKGKMIQTGGDMKDVVDSQIQQSSDRLQGKDPYERINRQLSEDIKKM